MPLDQEPAWGCTPASEPQREEDRQLRTEAAVWPPGSTTGPHSVPTDKAHLETPGIPCPPGRTRPAGVPDSKTVTRSQVLHGAYLPYKCISSYLKLKVNWGHPVSLLATSGHPPLPPSLSCSQPPHLPASPPPSLPCLPAFSAPSLPCLPASACLPGSPAPSLPHNTNQVKSCSCQHLKCGCSY